MPEDVKKGTIHNFIAYALSGILFFVFKIVAARGLGPEKFGIISVMLATVWIVSRLLATGIKDGATRFIAHLEAVNDTEGMTKVFLDCVKFTAAISLIFLAVYSTLFVFLTRKLFSDYLSLSLLFIGSCLFYFFLFFLRGVLQGLRELRDSALSILIEFGVMLIALICFFLIARDVRLAAVAIFLAPLFALVFIMLTAFKHRKRFSGHVSQGPGMKKLLGFVIPTSFINFSSGFLTQLGPLLIRFFSTFALAGVFTASLDIFKAARTALTALFISIFPHLSRQEALKNTEKLARMIRNGLILVGVVFILLVAVAATCGQVIVRFVYGAQFEIERVHLIMMALFTGFFLLSELFNRILLAKSMIKELSLSWGIALVVMIVLLLVPMTPLLRVEIAFLGAGSAAFIGMVLSFFLRTRQDETLP